MDLLSLSSIGSQFMAKYNNFIKDFNENFGSFLWDVLMTIVILILAKLILKLVSVGTKSVMQKKKSHLSTQRSKRLDSMMTLLRSTLRYLIYFIAILFILRQFNLFESMKGLVVTAGIGSLAIGFGAQSLVKDVVTGLFMMFENQFSVGDYIKTDEAEGIVEATAVRVTYLRTFKGEQVIIPNGSISRVVNYSRGNNLASITVTVPYEEDTSRVIDIIAKAVELYAKENADLIIEPPIVQGITAFGTSGVDIGVVCKVYSMKQWMVERGMRLAVKEAIDRSGILFPYQRITMDYRKATSVNEADSSMENENKENSSK